MKRLLAAFVLLCAVRTGGAPLRVSAAASLTDVLAEIAGRYREPLLFNFGASSVLARQIEEGAPCDVFIAADEGWMDRLAGRGLIDEGSRIDVLSNTLVIVVPSDSGREILSVRDLIGLRLALAQPESVPAGIYARQYFQKSGLWERIRPGVIPTENVRAALAAVEGGDVDAGVVYRTDALVSSRVRIAFQVPRQEGPRIVYPAAVLASSSRKRAAQDFVRFLRGAEAGTVFRRHGFLLP